MDFFLSLMNIFLDFLLYLIVDNITKLIILQQTKERRFDILISECLFLGFLVGFLSVYHHIPWLLIVLLIIQIIGSIASETRFDDIRRFFRLISEFIGLIFRSLFRWIIDRLWSWSRRRTKKVQPIPPEWKYNYHLKPIRDLRLEQPIDARTISPPGIVNLHGTTSSLNAILQSLASFDQFDRRIEEEIRLARPKSDSFVSIYFQISRQLRADSLYSEKKNSHRPVNPSSLIEKFNEISPGLISPYTRRSSVELFQRLIEILNRAFSHPSIVLSPNVLKQVQNQRFTTFSAKYLNEIFLQLDSELHRTVTLESLDEKASEILNYVDVTWLLHHLQQGSMIKELFSGQLLHANCYSEDSHVRFRCEAFQVLTLIVPPRRISLETLFNQLTKIEKFDLQSSTERSSRVRTQKMLANAPEILCVHLQRSTPSTPVLIEAERLIDLSSIFYLTWLGLTTLSPSISLRYRLMSVCLHISSSSNNGHDLSLSRHQQSRWFLTDDERVTEIHQINELFRSAYVTDNSSLLFFQRCS